MENPKLHGVYEVTLKVHLGQDVSPEWIRLCFEKVDFNFDDNLYLSLESIEVVDVVPDE